MNAPEAELGVAALVANLGLEDVAPNRLAFGEAVGEDLEIALAKGGLDLRLLLGERPEGRAARAGCLLSGRCRRGSLAALALAVVRDAAARFAVDAPEAELGVAALVGNLGLEDVAPTRLAFGEAVGEDLEIALAKGGLGLLLLLGW